MFPSTNFQILPTSLPTQTHTLSPRKITHKIKIKTNKKTVRWKNAKTKQKVHKKTYGVHFGFSNSFWALKLPWSVVDIPSNTLLGGKNWFFPLYQQVSISNSFLIRDETLHPRPLFSVGILSGLNLSCRHGQSLWVHMCITSVVSGRHCWQSSTI